MGQQGIKRRSGGGAMANQPHYVRADERPSGPSRGRYGLGLGVVGGRLHVVAGGPNPDLSVSDRLDAFSP